jgi:hypothetical protein
MRRENVPQASSLNRASQVLISGVTETWESTHPKPQAFLSLLLLVIPNEARLATLRTGLCPLGDSASGRKIFAR